MPGRPYLRTLAVGIAVVGAQSASGASDVAVSPAPQDVAVTVYRAPYRGAATPLDLGWLQGFALISEQRRIGIPAGEAEIRFEGVAGGILPESAIVTGLPDGVAEKNLDARLLSPGSLIEASLGKRVQLRRTSRATGEVREQEAIIRTGPGGDVVLQTREGFEALRCTGIPETIIYPEVPEGLSAKPTLSVRTRSSRATEATVTLSYLATGFDWQANYVATLDPSGERMDLFAWVTLANGDDTSFVRAQTQTVAGRVNRDRSPPTLRPAARAISLQCWPSGRTHQIPRNRDDEDIVVTGIRASLEASAMPKRESASVVDSIAAQDVGMMVGQEELGDLKLYRIPEAVTVAAHSQKQVALMQKRGVKVASFYRVRVPVEAQDVPVEVIRIVRTRNRESDGLGLPLPAGGVALFGAGYARPVLIGEGSVDDKAVGEDVEIEFPGTPGVRARLLRTAVADRSGTYRLTITSDLDRSVRFDAEFPIPGSVRPLASSANARLSQRNGRPLWSVRIPANGSVTLDYRLDRAS